MIKLIRHYRGRNTYVVKYKGIVAVANGCQCYTVEQLKNTFNAWEVSVSEQKTVLQAIDDINSIESEDALNDIMFLIKRYPREMSKIYYNINHGELADISVLSAAIKHDPMVIRDIDNVPYDLEMLAVVSNGIAIEYVEKQTPELCLAAVNSRPMAIYFIKKENLTPELKRVATTKESSIKGYLDVLNS